MTRTIIMKIEMDGVSQSQAEFVLSNILHTAQNLKGRDMYGGEYRVTVTKDFKTGWEEKKINGLSNKQQH